MFDTIKLTVISSVVCFLVGMFIKRRPNLTKKLAKSAGETGEFLSAVAEALADKKLTKAELNKCIKEAKDISDLWKSVDVVKDKE